MIRVAGLLLLAAAATRAEFMVLDPADYRENFVEGWPGAGVRACGRPFRTYIIFSFFVANQGRTSMARVSVS